MKAIKKLTLIKISTAILIILALFFSYQMPAGSIQKTIKISLLGISLLLMLIIIINTKESFKNWLNIALVTMISLTMFLYFFE